jgi:hypothetical protein
MDLYEASRRGDLLRLAYDSTRQGDPLTGLAVASYALRFGTLDVTEKVLGSEVGVHGTVIVGNAHRASAAMFGYDEIQSTANEEAEAKRLIHLFKVKAIPTGSNPNDAIIPVMAISETDRSVVGGLLALVELYNIKYGLRTFEEAFVHNNEPFFIGAKKRGGAKALKHLDRVRLRIDFKKGQRMTRMQTRRLHASLETFVEGLHAHRGAGKASKFRGLSTSREVADEVRRVIERRARIDAMADTQRTKRSARLAQARGLAKT